MDDVRTNLDPSGKRIIYDKYRLWELLAKTEGPYRRNIEARFDVLVGPYGIHINPEEELEALKTDLQTTPDYERTQILEMFMSLMEKVL